MSTSYKDSQLAIEIGQDSRKRHDHIVDSTNLLIFTFLLICIIITIWIFKHKRIPYIHETGLAIIYGSVFGIIIRYGFTRTNKRTISLMAPNMTLLSVKDIPEYIHLGFDNVTEKFAYTYRSPIRASESSSRQDYEEKATFDPEIFFNILLPPVIFNAGYSMKRRHFFKNFGAILLFSLLGTVISCIFFGGFIYVIISIFRSIKEYFTFADCLVFGAMISATDPVTILAIFNDKNVNVNLYALIFGESILNDASSIILLQAIEKYNDATSGDKFDINQFFACIRNFFAVFMGAFAIGSSMGCVTALLTKFTYIRQHANLETALFILMSYSTFLASEAAGLTGVVSLLFCGIFQAHYTFNNLSKESQVQTKQVFYLLNFLSENFIFIYIGITLFTYGNHKWEIFFIIGSLIGIVIARALNIYPLAYLINFTRSTKNKITMNMQHIMFFAGLRGAMAFALSIRNTSTPARKLMLTTTSVIVIITVFLGGGLTNNMLIWLGIKTGTYADDTEPQTGVNLLEARTSSESTSASESRDSEPTNFFMGLLNKALAKLAPFRAWHNFDNNFMKPLLTNSRPSLMETMPDFCLPLTMLLTTKEQLGLSTLTNARSSPNVFTEEPEPILMNSMNENSSNSSELLA